MAGATLTSQIPMPSKIVVKHPGNGSHGEQRA
jgi:hypothetical protein